MDASPLMRLPAELRNSIYELALTHEVPIIVSVRSDNPTTQTKNVPIGLIATCHQVQNETTTLFYTLNTFILELDFFRTSQEDDQADPSRSWITSTRTWLQALGPSNRNPLQHVYLDLGTFMPSQCSRTLPPRFEALQSALQTFQLRASALFVTAKVWFAFWEASGFDARYCKLSIAEKEADFRVIGLTNEAMGEIDLASSRMWKGDIDEFKEEFCRLIDRTFASTISFS